MKIPKIIFQAGKNKKFNDTKLYYNFKYPNYEYYFFTDSDIIDFFYKNPDINFPNIINQFNSLRGAHKADLFRYYFLYKNGGLYFDTDIELLADVNYILDDHEIVLCRTNPYLLMNGIIASTPQHEIIFEALKHIYEFNYKISNDYLFFCKKLNLIINSKKHINTNLREIFISGKKTIIKDKINTNIAYHHYAYKDTAYQKIIDYIKDNNLSLIYSWDDVFLKN